MNIDARIEELIEAPWQTVKAAAEAVGIQKGEGTWNDMADEIAEAEAALLKAESVPGPETKAGLLPKAKAKTVSAPDFTNTFLYKAGIDMCLNCGAKRAKHADGTDIVCCDNPRWRY